MTGDPFSGHEDPETKGGGCFTNRPTGPTQEPLNGRKVYPTTVPKLSLEDRRQRGGGLSGSRDEVVTRDGCIQTGCHVTQPRRNTQPKRKIFPLPKLSTDSYGISNLPFGLFTEYTSSDQVETIEPTGHERTEASRNVVALTVRYLHNTGHRRSSRRENSTRVRSGGRSSRQE